MGERKENVAVLFGGISVEHDISIITGVQTLNALKKSKYNVIPIYITKSGEWVSGEKLWEIKTYSNFSISQLKKVFPIQKGIKIGKIFGGKEVKIDFVYLALHGASGENGGVQGLLDMCDIPYSSCGVLGSSVCTNKYLAKLLCKEQHISVVAGVLLKEEDRVEGINKKIFRLKYPLVVKPNNLGSSIGVTFCNNEKELKDAINFAFMFDTEVLVERAVENLVEYNIALVGNRFKCEVSNIEEVVPDNLILSFEGKYMGGGKGLENLKRVVPAKIGDDLRIKIENIAKKIYKLFDLKGIVRLDFLFDKESGRLYFNEANTIPGSLANYLFKNHNYSFLDLLIKAKDYILTEKEIISRKYTRFSSTVLKNVVVGIKTNSKLK